jgi:hypothetical protein
MVPPTDRDAAVRAAESASAAVTDAYRRWPEVQRVAAGLRAATARSDTFADQIAEAFRSER